MSFVNINETLLFYCKEFLKQENKQYYLFFYNNGGSCELYKSYNSYDKDKEYNKILSSGECKLAESMSFTLEITLDGTINMIDFWYNDDYDTFYKYKTEKDTIILQKINNKIFVSFNNIKMASKYDNDIDLPINRIMMIKYWI